jgi:two-component system sensor histidine kinase VanS
MFKSIKTRLTLTIAGILLLVFLVQIGVNFLLAGKYYLYQKQKMIRNVFEELKSQAGTSENLIDLLRRLEIENNVDFILGDENMNPLYASRMAFTEEFPMDPRKKTTVFDIKKYPKEYYQSDPPMVLRTDAVDGDRLRLLGQVESGGTVYYIIIRVSVKSISADRKSTNLFVLYITSFAMLVGGALVYAITGQLTRPIEEINKVAVDVSRLDFSSRVPVNKRKDELGSLAKNINIMSDRLESDILRLQEANKRLEQDNEYMNRLDEQRKEFIANISHELKTPLAILTGYTEMLSSDVPGIDKSFYYDTILDETRKMDILIKNLLSLSNMENSLAMLKTEEVDLAELTERIFKKNSLLMQKKEIVGEFRAEPCKAVAGDVYYLEEAITNYLSNAIAYTDAGHRIIVKVEPSEEEAVLSVYNDGRKIEQDHMDKIWNSFYRADKSRTRTSQNNMGLGLYIVQSIMTAHHGRCGVINREHGVEFWLSLKTV